MQIQKVGYSAERCLKKHMQDLMRANAAFQIYEGPFRDIPDEASSTRFIIQQALRSRHH